MVDDKRLAENGKSVTLDNGQEVLYCEFGEENEEVIVSGAFYFITFNTFLKALAKDYHVYGFVMRTSVEGVETELNEDGTTNWVRQWGKEIYEATQKLGLAKFHYVGKCHGVMPGWYMVKNHPEVLLSMTSISQTLHTCDQGEDKWTELQQTEGPQFTLRTLKKHKLLPIKVKEAQIVGTTGTVGENKLDPRVGYYGSHAEAAFDSYEEVKAFYPTIKTPVLHVFATDDILYWDFKEANEFAIYNIPGSRTVILQGERHLMEMDMPVKLAREVAVFIEGLKLAYE